MCIKKPATNLGSGFVEIVVRRFSSTCQRRKQVQRPATHVVVMPKPSVAVNVVPKHCEALIPDERRHCQIQVTVSIPRKTPLWSATACRRFVTERLGIHVPITKRRQAVALQKFSRPE